MYYYDGHLRQGILEEAKWLDIETPHHERF